MSRVYVDHAATTPMLPEVAEVMQPWLTAGFGNPSSLHWEGRQARLALDEAREVLSAHLRCLFGEVIFTSSGTESCNHALIGSALHALHEGDERRRVLIGAAEHHCVLHCREALEALGFRVELIPVDREARVQPDVLAEMLDEQVLLVSVMHANNELGTINPIAEIGERVHRVGARFHVDAVQTLGAMPLDVDALGVDLLSVSAHKVYGPKAVGALYCRSGFKLKPLVAGGGQEREQRGGTENVAGIVGFAEAVRRWKPLESEAAEACREALPDCFPRSVVAGPQLAGHVHVRTPGVSAEKMLIRLDRAGVSASSGAACSSGSLEPSHVLLACGYTPEEANEGLRLTFGRGQTAETGRFVAERVQEAYDAIRQAH